MTPFKISKNLNYDNYFEYDSNDLPYSQNFRFVYYRINLYISSCLTKTGNGKITNIGIFYRLYTIYAFVHLCNSVAYHVPIANTDIYKCSFPPDH